MISLINLKVATCHPVWGESRNLREITYNPEFFKGIVPGTGALLHPEMTPRGLGAGPAKKPQ